MKNLKKIISLLLSIVMLFGIMAGVNITSYAAALSTGSRIQFGSYPQSRVMDYTTISALNRTSANWKSYNYYQKSSNFDFSEPTVDMQYADVTYNGVKYRGVKIGWFRPYCTIVQAYAAMYNDGTTKNVLNSNQFANGYDKDTTYWFRYEPITWRVLDPKTGLVMSEDIIDSQAYTNTLFLTEYAKYECWSDRSHSQFANAYDTSSIREWLNYDFYNAAFSQENKKYILTTNNLDNSAYVYFKNTKNFQNVGNLKYNSTNDKVFILSLKDVLNANYGFTYSGVEGDNITRIAKGSEYAKCQGLLVSSQGSSYGNGYWLLRTPGLDDPDYQASNIQFVDCDGEILGLDNPTVTEAGIRPAMRLNLSYLYPTSANKFNVSLSATTYTYDGKSKQPAVTVKDNSGKKIDSKYYDVKYSSNVNAGKATATITFKGIYSGTIKKTFTIKAKPASQFKASLSAASYTYDGKAKKPSVTVKNSNGNKIDAKYYDVKYTNNKKVGKATVTITFKGNYSGTIKKTFTIKPKSTSISKLTAGKKKFTVKWKKQATQTSGYEIQYATNSKFTNNKKTVTVKSNKTVSKSISKLKAKKKYYVRVRTYKTVNGKKIYSAWSKAKTVTTKK